MKVSLYTTLGCHLCEEAHAMLQYLQANGHPLEIESIEIADDENLMERYGIRIPVISLADAELGWPFNLEQLASFLANQGLSGPRPWE